MNARLEWVDTSVGVGATGVGATAQNPAQYADCNIAAPSDAGKGIIKRLQAYLQTQVPNSNVLQTGFLDAETCAAWRDFTADKPWMKKYPGNFNLTNILDTLDGASIGADGKIVHHWRCNGAIISPDCTQVPGREPGADPCPAGQKRDEAGECQLIDCGPGFKVDLVTGECVVIECPAGQQLDLATNQCVTKTARKKKKSGLGLVLLAAAAVGAIALGTA